jgi:tetratricopeptide (TPR) repeat protein
MRKLGVLALLVATGACAPKTVPLPVVTTPTYPEFVEPLVPPAFDNTASAIEQRRGWTFLQAGDPVNAVRDFELALKNAPAFYPAQAGLGYAALARQDAKTALQFFDRALEHDDAYVSALVGRGQALAELQREADAIAAFEAASAADPSLTQLADRIEVLKFRLLERDLSAARQAARAGRFDEAERAYTSAIASSPDSAFLYRELAAVERQQGQDDAALGDFRKAVELDSTDAASLAQIGEILDGRNDLDGASKAYSDALALEPSDELEGRLEAVRARAELARLPEEYRAIDATQQITRGELAALIGVRLAHFVQNARRPDAVVVTDVRGHWASNWIMTVARAGIMEPFANHTFQPADIVRRADLALVASRLLMRMAAAGSGDAQPWQSARLQFSDLPPGHLAYEAASMAVAAGVLPLGPDRAVQPSSPVSGAEAQEVINRFEALLDASGAPKIKGHR